MAVPSAEDITRALNSYASRDSLLKFPVTHSEARDRRVIGSITRVSYGTYNGLPACLVCMQFTFRYKRDSPLRFKRAEIIVNFDKRAGDKETPMAKDPTVQAYAPRKIFGPVITEAKQKRYGFGFQTPSMGFAGMIPIASVGMHRTSRFNQRHQVEVVGLDQSTRERPKSHIVIWTATEAKILKSGIPGELHFAAIVAHDGSFQADVQVKVDTPLKTTLFTSLWSKDDPALFIPPQGTGTELPTNEFDTLSASDWQAIIPYADVAQAIIVAKLSA